MKREGAAGSWHKWALLWLDLKKEVVKVIGQCVQGHLLRQGVGEEAQGARV